MSNRLGMAFIRLIVLFLFFAVFSQVAAVAQKSTYWIFFSDKDSTAYRPDQSLSTACIVNRKTMNLPVFQWTDVPVNNVYLTAIAKYNCKLIGSSKWLNAAFVETTPQILKEIQKESFVLGVKESSITFITSRDKKEKAKLADALDMLNAKVFSKKHLRGKGVVIGVTDAGFENANIHANTVHLYDNKKILGVKDFLDTSRVNFYDSQSNMDYHGRRVLELIGGTTKRNQMGLALDAKYYLARTENGKIEYRKEEYAWVKGMEWLDSLGVRLVNTSLGYGNEFSDTTENYSLQDIDGNTAITTKAAVIATEQKGICLVVSAGNEGNKKDWRIISTPADAKGVITVGAVKLTRDKAGYSSIGPEALPYTKPDVVGQSNGGTSFTAPQITGFIGCLLDHKPHLSNTEIKSILEKSAHLYPYHNNYVGYGLPQADRALQLADGKAPERFVSEMHVKDSVIVITNDTLKAKSMVVYHKKNETIVTSMSQINKPQGEITIPRPNKDVTRSTIDLWPLVIEVFWEDK